MLNRILKIFSPLLIASGILIIASLTLQVFAFNNNWYMREFEKCQSQERSGLNQAGLKLVSGRIIEYLRGRESNLNIQASVNGQKREVFNAKEKRHMADVRKIFKKVRLLTFIAAVVFIALFLIIYKYSKKLLYISLLLTGTIPVVLMLGIVIFCLIDFYKAFTVFHRIFFTNNLWILDPSKDILIQMLPQKFFEDMALHWSVFAGILYIICIITGAVGLVGTVKSEKN